MKWIKLLSICLLLLVHSVSLAQESSVPAEDVPGPAKTKTGNITVDFKDADIHDVLKIISYKSGVNIVAGADVSGTITIRLVDVPWEQALDVILENYGFGYERRENIIRVDTMENLKETLKTDVFILSYAKAAEISKSVESILSEQGKIKYDERTNALVITDTQSKLREIAEIVKVLDEGTHQIYIEAKFVEVDEDKLKEIGFDWGTGVNQVPAVLPHRKKVTVYYETIDDKGYKKKETYEDIVTASAQPLNQEGIEVLRGQFLPSEGLGLELLFQKLNYTQFEVVLSALEDEDATNIISNPKIMTVENKEAKILVGRRIPIPKYTYSKELGQQIISGYDEEEIGISFTVTPKVVKKNLLNLKIKTEVSEIIGWTGPNNERPIASTREAETEVTIENGETIMIGGLVKDKVITGVTGIPILKDIPILGLLFRKTRTEKEKVDLVIFITARLLNSESQDLDKQTKLDEE